MGSTLTNSKQLLVLTVTILLILFSCNKVFANTASTANANQPLLVMTVTDSEQQGQAESSNEELLYQNISAEIRAVLERTGTAPPQDWTALQNETTGFTVSTSVFHPHPINAYDLDLLMLRSDWLSLAMLLAFFGMIATFTLFSLVNGPSKVTAGYSGKLVKRWSKFDIFIHWLCGLPCIFLILSGLVLLAGRFYLHPLISDSFWATLIHYAKASHDILLYPFMIGWFLMCIKWVKDQLPKLYDINWFLMAGGYLNFGPLKGKHPDAGFVNAGEKMWFWCFALVGVFLVGSGLVLLFPTELGATRTVSLFALITHASCAIIISAFSIVHIFMATVLSEGSIGGMISGYVDENWAKQHHNIWYDEITENKTIEYKK